MNFLSNSLFAWGLPQGPELWILVFLVFLLFGAKRLPTLARSVAKSIQEFRRAKTEFQDEMHKAGEEITLDDSKLKTPPTPHSDTYPRQG